MIFAQGLCRFSIRGGFSTGIKAFMVSEGGQSQLGGLIVDMSLSHGEIYILTRGQYGDYTWSPYYRLLLPIAFGAMEPEIPISLQRRGAKEPWNPLGQTRLLLGRLSHGSHNI